MSGFESAIRNAISRAPDGRPQTRARIYTAARSSLERNLARAELPDAEARRASLELTIERIEAEWEARRMRRPGGATRPAPPRAPVPSDASGVAPEVTARSYDGAELAGSPVRIVDTSAVEGTFAEGSDPSVAKPPAPDTPLASAGSNAEPHGAWQGRTDEGADAPSENGLPMAGPLTATTSAAAAGSIGGEPARPAPEMSARASTSADPVVTETRRGVDPALVQQLAARDGPQGAVRVSESEAWRGTATAASVPARDPPQKPSLQHDAAAPGQAGATGGAVPAREEPFRSEERGEGGRDDTGGAEPVRSFASDPVDRVREDDPIDGPVPELGPAVEPVERPTRARSERTGPARSARGRGEAKRAGGRGAGRGERSSAKPRRGRRAGRIASIVLLVVAALVAYRWLDAAGMLEAASGRDQVAITVPRAGVEAGPADPRPWTALMTRELAGAVEPVAGQDALRVTGPAEVALDADALAALGPDISVSLLVRAVAATGEVAVACEFTGGGCGRLRFPLPREAQERVIQATIGAGERARLVLDPTVGGEPVPFDLLGVTARSR